MIESKKKNSEDKLRTKQTMIENKKKLPDAKVEQH